MSRLEEKLMKENKQPMIKTAEAPQKLIPDTCVRQNFRKFPL